MRNPVREFRYNTLGDKVGLAYWAARREAEKLRAEELAKERESGRKGLSLRLWQAKKDVNNYLANKTPHYGEEVRKAHQEQEDRAHAGEIVRIHHDAPL